MKWFHENNYMQGIEGDIDTAHVSFLHWTIGRPRRASAPMRARRASAANCSAWPTITRA